jgi:hypothetical protein
MQVRFLLEDSDNMGGYCIQQHVRGNALRTLHGGSGLTMPILSSANAETLAARSAPITQDLKQK